MLLVTQNHRLAGKFGFKRLMTVFKDGRKRICDAFYYFGYVGFQKLRLCLCGVDFRQRQQFFDKLRHSVAFFHNNAGGFFYRENSRLYSFRIALNRHERRFQFVRGVLEKRLPYLLRRFDCLAEF